MVKNTNTISNLEQISLSMKALSILFACLVSLGVWAGGNDNTFEGNLLLTTTHEGKTTPSKLKLTVKGDNVLIDATATQKDAPLMMVNSKTGDVHILTDKDGQKVAIKLNTRVLNSVGGLGAISNTYGLDVDGKAKGTVTETNETKTISGYKCRKYLVKDDEYESEFWITEELGLSLPSLLGNVSPENNLPKGMILEGKGKKIKGDGTFSFKVEPTAQTVDATLFTIPKEYRVMDITFLIEQMLNSSTPEEVKKMLNQMVPKK